MRTLLAHTVWVPLEGAINQVLAHSQQSLSAYAGKQISVHIQPNIEFDILILQQGIRLGRLDVNQPDASVQVKKSDCLSLLNPNSKWATLITNQCVISGDDQLINELANIVDSLEIDWARLIQPVTGALLAQTISSGLSAISNFTAKTSISPSVIRDFLEQENPQLAGAQQMQKQKQQLQDLEEKIQNIQQRLKALKTTQEASNNG